MKVIRFLFIVKENPPPTTGDGLYTQHRLKKSFEHFDCSAEASLHLGDTCDMEGAILALPCIIEVTGGSDNITLPVGFGESVHLDFFHEEASDTVSLNGALPCIGVGDYALSELGF